MNLKAIGRILKQQRQIKGLDYEEIAARARVHSNTVRGVELGDNDHKLGTFESIGKVLGLSLLDIVRAGQTKTNTTK